MHPDTITIEWLVLIKIKIPITISNYKAAKDSSTSRTMRKLILIRRGAATGEMMRHFSSSLSESVGKRDGITKCVSSALPALDDCFALGAHVGLPLYQANCTTHK